MSNIYQTIFFIKISIILSSCSGVVPLTIGQFARCPEKPNCVSTKNSSIENTVKPIFYKGSHENAKQNLLLAIKKFGSAKVKKELDQFIHVEFTSDIFRFIDDVEFYLKEQGVIHFRSASRIGHSDLGVNRRRVEMIRIAFNNLNKTQEKKRLKPVKDQN
ncbi:DUF1499 domain-containing protein [Nitrospinae bacterium]|jgi:uncharacterized protein (DUF1499 family)|nr:DUF1499 domain-containing protein [Nitrospinota bacterium]